MRKLADEIDSIIMEFDLMLAERIKNKKFYFHNREWVDEMEQFEKTVNWNQYLDEMNQYGWDEEDDPNGLDPKMFESDSEYD
mmetsp:Transcript_15773/g.13416  ORF Transcript_15773/g.13416 Transcript_15773/m.13416 type:complete len:82 (+) Transcript_15773:217-462(+)|eukprot:CAMPEP_0114575576 /NCGR_PEP_ID=MMETSP0125-20121206/426_1 /TAXON_ID=485358 ORGANISM="Aristerostoma sp., Strain ATCC 50986" /NCGR_SAMPLE_ID=MMETSP0125 /ASSEMBLY_ACC=CAM_ASM_000245 /LENGTH=81 /DNA_ID=CAMNT_0001763405 /DNA_START=535 /DNA_END=780 /DNA_ORIENTATION=+